MRGKRALVGGLVAIGLVVGGAIVADAVVAPTPVAKLCKDNKTKIVYQRGTCKAGETAITLKSVVGPVGPAGPVGPQGLVGPAGPAGPAGAKGDDAGIVKKCVSVALNATYQSRPDTQRQVTIEGLPPYTEWSNGDLWANNVVAVNDGPGNVFLSNLSGLNDGSTELRFQVNPSNYTGSETDTLKVCVARLSLN
jgi:hypothetical protein